MSFTDACLQIGSFGSTFFPVLIILAPEADLCVALLRAFAASARREV
jgi:hypothetical protein